MTLRVISLLSGLAMLSLVPSIAAGEGPAFGWPPTLQTVVVNPPEKPVPVRGSVAVTVVPRARGTDLFDQTVRCVGYGPNLICDAKWEGSVLIESLSAHCQGSGGMVRMLKVITSQSPTAPSTPADKLAASPGTGATLADAFEGARRWLALAWLPSQDPSVTVTGITPLPMRALVPQDRFVRLVVEGDPVATSCFVAFSGRWLD